MGTIDMLPELVVFRILKILFYQHRPSFLSLCLTSQRFATVNKKYFNQITKLEMAARKIQFCYRFYLKITSFDYIHDDSIDLTKYIITHPASSIRYVDFNKIKNGIFNKAENYMMKMSQTVLHYKKGNGGLVHIIPIIMSTLRQVRIRAMGDIIGKVSIIFGQQTIVDKVINKKEIRFYINAPLPCFSCREIHTEHPTTIHGLFCDINLNIIGVNILFKYRGNFQSIHGVALPHHQYLI